MKLPVNYDKLTPAERQVVKQEYVKQQKGLCYHCKASLTGPPAQEVADKPVSKKWFPDGFFENPVHLHHNHNTKLTLGVVHAHCNAVLWQYHGE